MAHYFTNEAVGRRDYKLDFTLFGRGFTFQTADGVFSKGGLDEGTNWLLTAILPGLKEQKGHAVDLGCGYGAIGVILASLAPNLTVTMLDINESAVSLANLNAAKNGVGDRARAIASDGLSLIGVDACIDIIVTNPPFRAGKAVVNRFFEESRRALKQGGRLFAVLRKQQGADSYIKAIIDIFGNCEILMKKKGYVVVETIRN